jgi:hypothetical protein
VLVNASISQLCANRRGEIFRFLSFVSLRWIGYACVPMACSASPKPIGTVNSMALFAYTLFAFAMALLALLAFPKFAAFSLFVPSPDYALACSRVYIFSDPVRFLSCARNGTLSMGGAIW